MTFPVQAAVRAVRTFGPRAIAPLRLYYYATFRAAAFPGRRERSLCLFLVAWEGHQADKKAK